MCFVQEPTETEESAVSCHLSRGLGITNAAFVICEFVDCNICNKCVDNNDDLVLMDRHLHFPKGGLLTK